MAGSMKEALKLAMQATGEKPLPASSKAKCSDPAPESENPPPVDFLSALEGVTPLRHDKQIPVTPNHSGPVEAGHAHGTKPSMKTKPAPVRKNRGPSLSKLYEEAVRASVENASHSAPPYRHLRSSTPAAAPPKPQVHVVLCAKARMWQPAPTTELGFLRPDDSLGANQQIASMSAGPSRDVVIGLDFGTSASKLVITDRTLQQAFAVPFRNGTDAAAYILPSVLHESEAGYSLVRSVGTTASYPGLKLALFRNPYELVNQARIAAYVGLLIRNARAWLFATRADEYRSREIIWSLALGQPADHGAHAAFQAIYRTVAVAGWALSCWKGPVPAAMAMEAVERARRIGTKECEAEVLAMPEIAAQVYGFITSTHFDAAKRNVFLLADVGAGTLDACLFRVNPGRVRSQWELEVYTSDVKEHGVINLHDYRIHWWQRELGHVGGSARFATGLEAIKVPIEQGARIPPTFRDYFEDVAASFSGGAHDPDQTFYDGHVLKQVRGSTLYHAFSSGVLDKQELAHVPFFLCGGGSRMAFYQQLNESLVKTHGFSWLSAMGRELTLPKNLVAEGLARSDFDRLSVAYGLSQLTLASSARAQPAPRASSATAPEIPPWRNDFIDKDQV